jgi:hypothetical protein
MDNRNIGDFVPHPESWQRQIRDASPQHAVHLYRLALAHLDDIENRSAWDALCGIAASALEQRRIPTTFVAPRHYLHKHHR